jgi:hypothetical protein
MAKPVLAVKPGAGGPQVMKSDNRWNAQLGGHKDNVIRESQPVVNVNQIGAPGLQMLAKE